MSSVEHCQQCLKPERLCVCAETPSLANRHHVLILQHPQEPDKELGTARMAQLALQESTLKVGLSWPNLKAALGRPEVQPSRWGVLYLGNFRPPSKRGARLVPLDKKGTPLPDADAVLKTLDGIIALDGTWSQAKALWWRNAWLLKCRRIALIPSAKSLYGKLRKEPRGECLSTIESIADSLEALGEPPEHSAALRRLFGSLLDRYRSQAVE